MRIFNGLLVLLYGYFTYVQFNDPDATIWIIAYGYAVLLALLGVFGKLNIAMLWIGIVGLGILSAFAVPGVIDWLNSGSQSDVAGKMQESRPYIEETREFGGLLITIVGLVINLILLKKKGK